MKAAIEDEVQLKLTVDVNPQTGTISAAYLHIRQGKSARILEFARGNVLADYDRKRRLLGIELLGPCDVSVLETITRKEAEPIREFVRQSIPRGLALATAR